jgi:hypothetical protein
MMATVDRNLSQDFLTFKAYVLIIKTKLSKVALKTEVYVRVLHVVMM